MSEAPVFAEIIAQMARERAVVVAVIDWWHQQPCDRVFTDSDRVLVDTILGYLAQTRRSPA
jgi:hypothetical protein